MTDEEKPEQRESLWSLLRKPTPHSAADLQMLRENLEVLIGFSSPTRDYASARFSIELLDAIRRFDESSGSLVDTTNQLTNRILVLTKIAVAFAAVAAMLGGASLWVSILALKN